MGVSPARTANVKLPDRSLLVDGYLSGEMTCYWNKSLVNNINKNNNNNNYNNKKDINIKTPYSELTIYHQNVRGLGNKVGDLETHILPLLPQIICLTKHHLSNLEIGNININQYLLGAFYCRSNHKFGGVNIFVHESLTYSTTDLNRYCYDHDLEACAIKFKIGSTVYCIVCLYRPTAGNLNNFLKLPDSMLAHLHTSSINLIICSDIKLIISKPLVKKISLTCYWLFITCMG